MEIDYDLSRTATWAKGFSTKTVGRRKNFGWEVGIGHPPPFRPIKLPVFFLIFHCASSFLVNVMHTNRFVSLFLSSHVLIYESIDLL